MNYYSKNLTRDGQPVSWAGLEPNEYNLIFRRPMVRNPKWFQIQLDGEITNHRVTRGGDLVVAISRFDEYFFFLLSGTRKLVVGDIVTISMENVTRSFQLQTHWLNAGGKTTDWVTILTTRPNYRYDHTVRGPQEIDGEAVSHATIRASK